MINTEIRVFEKFTVSAPSNYQPITNPVEVKFQSFADHCHDFVTSGWNLYFYLSNIFLYYLPYILII